MNGFNFVLYLIFALLLSCRPSVDSTDVQGATESVSTPQNIGLLTKSPSSDPSPRFIIQGDFRIGNTVGLYLNGICSDDSSIGSVIAQNNTTAYITSLPLTQDGVYTYWSKVTSRSGESSRCSSSQATYSFQTGQTDIVLDLPSSKDANLNPLVVASNVSIGASVFIFTDSSCLQLVGSESFVSSTVVEVKIDDGALTNDGPYTFYARQVLGNVNGPCSGTTPPATYILNTKPTFMQTITPSPGLELRPSIRIGNGDNHETAGALVPGAEVRIFNEATCSPANQVGMGTALPNETTVLITLEQDLPFDNTTYKFWSTQKFGNHTSPCSLVFSQYNLDARPSISLVTNSPGDETHPIFNISGLQPGSTAQLYEGEVCQGSLVGQVISTGTSTSIETTDALILSGSYSYSAKQILPSGLESDCSSKFATYAFESSNVLLLTSSPNNIYNPELAAIQLATNTTTVSLYPGASCQGAPLISSLPTGGASFIKIVVPKITEDGFKVYSISQNGGVNPGGCIGWAIYEFNTKADNLKMVEPVLPIGNSATPTFSVANIVDYTTATVTLHTASDCSTPTIVGTFIGQGPTAQISVSIPIDSEGPRDFYVSQEITGVTKSCSAEKITYEYDLKPPVINLAGPSSGNDPTPTIIVDKVLNEGLINIYTGKSACDTLRATSPSGNGTTRTIISSALGIYDQGDNIYWATQTVNGLESACSTVNTTYNFNSSVGDILIVTDTGATPIASGQSNTPLIQVKNVMVGALVELFVDNTCITTIGSGTSTESAINILSFPLGIEGEHKYYARQTIDGSIGPCSSHFATYTLDTTPNSPILITASPNTILTPTVRVTDIIPGAQVKLFLDRNCADLVGETQANSSQVDVSVRDSSPLSVDGDYYFYVRQVNAGHISPCSAKSNPVYTLDTRPKGIAVLDIPTQTTPENTWNNPTPTIRVSGVEPGAKVIIFKDQNCQVDIGTGISTQNFIDIEVVSGGLPSDGHYTIYARQTYRGHTSSCSGTSNPVVGTNYLLATSISLSIPGTNPNNLLKPEIIASQTVSGAIVQLFTAPTCASGTEISLPTTSSGGDTTLIVDPPFTGDEDKAIFGKQTIDGFDSPCSSQLTYSLFTAPTIVLDSGSSPSPGNSSTPNFLLSNLIMEPSVGTTTVTIFDDVNCTSAVSFTEVVTDSVMLVTVLPLNSVGNKTYYTSQSVPNLGHISSCSPQGAIYDYNLSPLVSMTTPSPSDELKPTIEVRNVVIGADVNLFNNSGCSNLVGSAVSATATEISITLDSDLPSDGRYNFYAQQTSSGNTSPCSFEPAIYDLETDDFSIAPTITKATDTTPDVLVSNIKIGDRITLYFDDLCIIQASDEATATNTEIQLTSYPLETTEKIHNWYAIRKIGNEGFQSRCVGPSLPYELNIMPSNVIAISTPNPGLDLQPEFEVQGVNHYASVTIYTDSDCGPGNEVGSANSGPSDSVFIKTDSPLTEDGPFTVWARQFTNNHLSECSESFDVYVLDTTPQGLSLGLGTTSPGDNPGPRIRVDGVVEKARVELYFDNDCTTAVTGSDIVPAGDNFIEIDSFPLGQDGTYNYWARQTLDTDPPYISPCSASSTSYVLDTMPTNMLSLTTQPSAQNAPKILVEGVGDGDLVKLFRDMNCTIPSGSNISSSTSVSIKVLPTLEDPETYSFYSKRIKSGGLGATSNCSIVKADFEFNPALSYKWEFSQQVQKDIQDIDEFAGSAVTGSADYLVMGVPGATANQGRIYFWKYNGFFWESEGSLSSNIPVDSGLFGTSLDLYTFSSDGKIANGDLLIIGAPGEEAAYIYNYQNGSWLNEQKLTGTNIPSGSEFGFSVAINQTMALIGAPDRVNGTGAIRSFENRNGSFAIETEINPPFTLAQGDGFGFSLSINGDNILIAAPGRDTVFIYNGQSKVPVYSSSLIGVVSAEFGYSVDLSSDFAIIGAPNDSAADGRSYIYLTSNWSLVSTVSPTTGSNAGRFGASVSITELGKAIVGEPDNVTGQAYIFGGNNFTSVVDLPLFNNVVGNRVGASVFILNDNILVGAPGMGTNAGAVYIYRNDL
ncbi:MAG: hypothetical protein DRQ88_03935 [Epsilonproteobacteria bacterium]|nr:MAG: hypothetical protein DRQ89_04240 [Campylobacterota bacterium]RLA67186.1 MAG: hypothetical protein DRQ88_03935 [Campylobacterota bacterium]